MPPHNLCEETRCKQTPVDEFELIRRFFNRSTAVSDVATGIGDDGAVLKPRPGFDQVQVIDTLVEGVHFLKGTSAADIGYRAVAINLSDVAAMGAQPRWMTLALTLPSADDDWLAGFAEGLFQAADQFGVALVGGDTTSGDQVVATVHMTAEVEPGKALLRSTASAGESVFVTGTVGDAAAGLELLRRGEPDAFLIGRFLRPSARIEIGQRLIGRATAAIDLSDGLAGDLSKLLDASGVAGEISVERLPTSDALRSRVGEQEAMQLALTGGDDYELCFTAMPDAVRGIANITAIGKVTDGAGLTCLRDGAVVEYDARGYRHFL